MTAIAAAAYTQSRPTVRQRLGALVDRWGLGVYAIVAVLYLLLPIIVMVVFSFNTQVGKFNYVWHGFSLAAWGDPLGRPGMGDAIATSLKVAFISTLVATALGTLIALSLTRYRFFGRSATNLFIFLPMATPEIVMGASLLTLFVNTATPPFSGVFPKGLLFPLGFNTILIAHIMFNISYVVVTVKARMAGFDRRLEEAAMDLGANEWTTFWKVTFPLIFPGILAAALLAFSLSIDDFVITNFTSGLTNTFPIWVWGSLRNSLPVQINVVGTIIFLTAVGLVALGTLLQRRQT
jgi:spermidine/putrescine transport system permease protein